MESPHVPSETEHLSLVRHWGIVEELRKGSGSGVLDRPYRVLVWHQLELDCF